MDPHDLTKNQNSQHPDHLQLMQAMHAGQNFNAQTMPGKKLVLAPSDLKCSAAAQLDSPVHPPVPANSGPAQNSTTSAYPLSANHAMALGVPANAQKVVLEPVWGKPAASAGQTDQSGSNGLSTAHGVLSANNAAKTPQDELAQQTNMPGACVVEVSEFAGVGHGPTGSGSLAAQQTSVNVPVQSSLAFDPAHNSRGNQMNQQTYQQQVQQLANQQMIQQSQAFQTYIQNFLNMQGQSGNPNGMVDASMLQFAGQQISQQFTNPSLVQIVVPQGSVMPQPMMHGLPTQFTAPMPIIADQQVFLQQMNQNQATDAPKELTLEMLLRQMQNVNQAQIFPQPTEPMQFTQGFFFGGNQPMNNVPMSFFQQNLSCTVCQQGGELIKCASCSKPYHILCAGLSQMPTRWECEDCVVLARDNLIRELKEKAQKKIQEREKRKEAEQIAKNEAKQRREIEAKLRKEEKDRIREEQRQQRAELLQQAANQRKEEALKLKIATATQAGKEAIINPDTQQPYDVQGPLKIGQVRSELLELVITLAQQSQPKQAQLGFGPDGQLITITSTVPQPKKKKTEAELTPEERARKERNRLIKSQMQIFSNLYPELVERNSIRYPIKDDLLLKLPELHGVCPDPKPEPYKINVSAEEFEKLIYIWEFCNNFNDYLDTPTFKLEELKCALSYSEQDDANLMDEMEIDWNEQMRLKHIREKGLHMINCLHTALVTCFLDDLFPENKSDEPAHATNTRAAVAQQQPVQLVSAQGESGNQVLQAIDKLIENKNDVWPEIVRLVLLYKVEQDGEDFGPYKETIESLLSKLIGLRPAQYLKQLTFEEKVCLMTVLIDGIHDTDAFRKFLNDRIEEKSSFNKEKIEVYGAIRQLEQEQQELIKKHAESHSVTGEEEMKKELEDLRMKLKIASRIQSKDIRERIFELEAEQNHFSNENSRLEELIKKRQSQITKLNEKLYKSSIKTTMLGQDAQRSEYWHFKDDCSRIYIRKEELQTKADAEMQESEQIVTDSEPPKVVQWYYYEREEQLELLIERLNYKGFRERRLQESLRRVKDILKLKKTRKQKPQELEKAETEEKSGEAKTDEQMNDEANKDQGEEQEVSESEPDEKHVMFETDNYSACMHTAVWFGQKIPPKRRMFGRSASNKQTESELGDNLVTLQECKNILVRIQNLYTETSRSHDREWSDKAERESWAKQVTNSLNCEQLTALMIKLDEGMCQPFFVAQRGGHNQRLKLQLFKFWPSSDLKHAWRQYVEDENTLAKENLNSFYIILRILEQINEQFIIRQDEKMEKKNKAAINAAVSEKNVQVSVNQRGRYREVNYVKYFQSSDSEEEQVDKNKDVKMRKQQESEDDEESEPDQTLGAKSGKSAVSSRQQRAMQRRDIKSGKQAPKQTRRNQKEESESEESDSDQYSDDESSSSEEEVKKGRGRAAERKQATRGRAANNGRGRRKQESDEEDSDEYESSEEQDSSREWDEYCFVCQDGGNVLCCEGCNQVAHVRCLKLKTEPTGDWHCPDCLKKQTMTRLTRNHDAKSNRKPVKARRRF